MAIFSPQFASAVALIVAASLCLIEANQTGIGIEIGSRGQREFDYFKLALQWPGTFCQHTRHCCSSNACCRGANSPTVFTIHGLWPDYNDGTWPACCTQKSFDEKEISTLHDALEKYWPSLSCGRPSSCHGGKGSFWGHEWEKHGTCSSPVARDEYSYFLTTLNVYFKYNVTKVLNEAGYVPSNTEKYPLGGIVSAIQNAFRTTPKLLCKKGLWRNFIYASTRISSLGIVRLDLPVQMAGYIQVVHVLITSAYQHMHQWGLAVVKRKFQVPDADVL
ncbi:ribonuclease 2 [Prunus yedoensis var. nudiflora]|uniref:Ribonuclease 2 n=1 Tax=Prunus yedoensis var. nudiflora TaxID=2094558 RepID=A0A314UZF7_PRUYE|nr:ribonuclease 2 [Prunus yedoensis var. nudiflora]